MPNFQAKTSEDIRGDKSANVGPQAVEELPSVDVEAFGFVGDAGSAMHRHFVYATRQHTLDDILRPGYFGVEQRPNDIRDFGVRSWDTIAVTIGDDPATAFEVDLRVVSIGTSRAEAVIVSKGQMREFRLPK